VTETGVLVLTGPPCAGKSSVARRLVADTTARAVPIEVDALFSLLLPGSDRNRKDRMLAYDAAHALAALVLERGRTPVLECTYARREQRAGLVAALAGAPDAPLWAVEFLVSPDEAVQRFRRRDQETDLDERLVRERVETFPYSDHGLRLDSAAAGPEELAARIDRWRRGRPGSVPRDGWVEAGKGWDRGGRTAPPLPERPAGSGIG
jgi:predicted kinase